MAKSRTAVLMLCVVSVAVPCANAANVEDQKAVIDAQIEILRKQAELNTALRQVAGSSALGLPTVVSITQMGDQRVARLQLRNGVVGNYRQGEVVQPGMVLTSIAAKQVLVAIENGRRTIPVPLEFAGASTSFQGGPGAMPGSPNAQSGAPIPDALLPPPPQVFLPPLGVVPPVSASPANKPAQVGK